MLSVPTSVDLQYLRSKIPAMYNMHKTIQDISNLSTLHDRRSLKLIASDKKTIMNSISILYFYFVFNYYKFQVQINLYLRNIQYSTDKYTCQLSRFRRRLPISRNSSDLQVQRQDSVTGGTEINFGGAQKVYLCEFKRDTGARKIYSSVDQTNKVKTKKKVFCSKFLQIKKVISSKIFTNSGCHLKVLAIFHEFLSEDQKKKKKRRSLSQKLYKIRCGSTKI